MGAQKYAPKKFCPNTFFPWMFYTRTNWSCVKILQKQKSFKDTQKLISNDIKYKTETLSLPDGLPSGAAKLSIL